ncbi:MAG: protein of unknown function UPF0118 [uncultured bacterium]|nr:MAG: protein of unknown function UPF0118 [uncultured bacterium]KKQ43981.1 MAG: hypothetical protein US63_C0038G0005 [Candidatus Moranbacteria bacterium GW2011_GWC2_37_8]KKQ60404.1 MAG: protein of unknown function UPF0118 [Parcubacteria group bacterium GW2011_GWC1_38_22]
MELKRYNVYFFFITLVGISVVTYFVFKPFLMPILLAAILAVMFQRPYNFFVRLTNDSRRISAFFISFLGIIIFSAFFLSIIGLILNEASNFYHTTLGAQEYQNYLDKTVNNVNNNNFLKSIGFDNIVNADTIKNSVSQLGQNAFAIVQKTYQGIASLIFFTVIMFFTLYYFLISGKALVKHIMYLSPLRDAHEKILIKKFISISRATIKGTLIVGIVQGSIGATLFAVVGIPSAVVWGIVMMFLSLIPMLGTGLIWLPAAIIMFLLGNVWQGIVILIVGGGIISTIDNFLRPKLVGNDTQMHPLIVFFSTLGGISLLGFFGFIVGPIIVALFLALWEIYGVEFKSQLKNFNS